MKGQNNEAYQLITPCHRIKNTLISLPLSGFDSF